MPDLKLGFKEMNKERSSVFGHRHGGPGPADKNTEAAGVILQRSKDLQTAPGGRVDLAVAHGPKAALLHTRLLGHFILCSPVWLPLHLSPGRIRLSLANRAGNGRFTLLNTEKSEHTCTRTHTQVTIEEKMFSECLCQSIADEEILISATSKTTTLTNKKNL